MENNKSTVELLEIALSKMTREEFLQKWEKIVSERGEPSEEDVLVKDFIAQWDQEKKERDEMLERFKQKYDV